MFMKTDKVKKLWDEFRKIPFPKEAYSFTDSLGADIVLDDSLAAGCISTYLNAGKLSKNQKDL